MGNDFRGLYEFGSFRFDAKTNTLWRENELISLPPKALGLLKLLIEKQGEVVSKQEIFDTVWAETFVEEGVLTQNIYTLRQTLGTDEKGKPIIENLARRGYRITVPIYNESERERGREDGTMGGRDSETLPLNKFSYSNSKTFTLIITSALILIVLAFLGYRFLTSQSSETSQTSATELKFKQLTDTGDVSYLTISPDGNLVAYTRGFDVYLRNLISNSEAKLKTENAGKIGCLQFSPDGNSIYFGNVFNRDEKGSIFRVTQEGGIPVEAAADVWSGFSVSPNGREIAFVRKIPAENKQAFIIKNLETGTEKTLRTINLPEELYWNNYPAWSADGKKIAVVAVTQSEHFSRILLLNSENGAEEELKPKNFRNIEQVVWNTDGDSLIAAANDGSNFQLWKITITDGNAKRITNDLNSYLGIAISQDRKKLISRQRIYFSNIWVGKKSDLSNLKQLTEGTSRNDGLQGLNWLDEERIVYTSNDEKIRDWNLWLLNTTDGAKQKLTTDSEIQNDNPEVAPNRQTIYFASDRNKESRIWRINSDGSNPQQVTFGEDETHHFPQVSPDGKWLYFIIKSRRSSTIGRKSLTENSVQELSGKIKFVPGNFLTLSPDGKFLAFQNIAYQTQANHPNPKLQVAILSTENPDDVRFKEIEVWRQVVEWGENDSMIDFVTGNVKETGIMRQTIQKDDPPTQILPSSQATIFNFTWSPSGEHLAIARGQLLRDVVLLTNFD
ncbi:MAG TPA: winged helix-turn-helix domain-containing protein [Pyrinomonadaceae bacterium]|nr:winged helix-turn-helix domain-containing protein [Pyrinomonadaceae bacterium]